MDMVQTDILILGSGGAGLLAALHARKVNPEAKITIAVKGLLGKTGCTRMVQGGYNVAVAEGDSAERHFMDTIDGGKWLNNQDLAWALVTGAQDRIRELENEHGCFFDRNPDGSMHQKAFAGQTFDRTVHKGDLTGIEIINRLAEQVWSRDIERMEDHRAVELIKARDSSGLAGVLMIDMRSGGFRYVGAKAVLVATGGGPSMYLYHTPSGDKSCDGMAMLLRAGLPLRDMEMVQFHPTGLVAGRDTRITGTIIEEGLRGYGGHLLAGDGRRFMHRYDEREERATRDIVSRAMYEEMRAGNVGPNGGLYITMKHLDAGEVRKRFKGMVERCADVGFDLVGGDVEVVPTAHYMMGGCEFNLDCSTALPGLFVAGEDAGGVHGANRLGGNGVANSTVFGGIAGESMGVYVRQINALPDPDQTALDHGMSRCRQPLGRARGNADEIRQPLYQCMWDDVGIIRDAASLDRSGKTMKKLEADLADVSLDAGNLAYNLGWHDWLNLHNLLLVSEAIRVAAIARENSRGAHYRADFPDAGDLATSRYTKVALHNGAMAVTTEPVEFSRVHPEGSAAKKKELPT
ncbi:MAG: FAD-binding protein [Alphaproteobacteria bacterium]|jgi:fumarate reductase flavoprotein subunit|nr:FAD-binding protein [Alphaproteobacteria bacterium]